MDAREALQAAAVSATLIKKRHIKTEEEAQLKRAKKVKRAAERNAATSSNTFAQQSNLF